MSTIERTVAKMLAQQRIRRRTALKAGLALGGVAGLQGAASIFMPGRALAQDIGISTMRSTSKSWLWAAEDFATGGGYFAEAGVTVESNASGRGVNVPALIGGAVDVVLGTPDQSIRAQIQNQPVKLIAATVDKYASNVVVNAEILAERGVDESSPVADKVEAMRGLRMGTTGPGAAPDSLLRYLFSTGDINPDTDVELVTIQGGGSAILAAVEQGVIDGFCLSSPTSDVSNQQFGTAYLFNMATNPPPALENYFYIGCAVLDEAIQERRSDLVAYVKGLTLALRAINDQPDVFREWARGWFDSLDDQLFDVAFANNSRIYTTSPVPTEAQFELNKQFVNIGFQTLGEPALPEDFSFQDACDPSIAEEAVASLN